MRRFTIFAVAMMFSVGFAGSAEAKKPKAEPAATEEAAPAEGEAAAAELTIEMTGIADVDNIFTKANAPLESIKTARMAIDSLSTNLTTALGLPAGTPLKDAFADLKTKAEGKIELAMDEGGMPSLKAGDAVPENVQQAIDAVNGGIKDVQTAVGALAEVPNQVKEVVAAAQAFNPSSLISSGVKATEAPKVMKKITGNLKVLGKAPDEVTALKTSAEGLVTDLKGSFSAM